MINPINKPGDNHPDDANLAESAPRHDHRAPATGEPAAKVDKGEQRPSVIETPPALRDYRGGDAG